MPHPRQFIGRGVLAGAVGGLLAFAFARILAEPLIGQAIDYETGRDQAQEALNRAAGVPVAPAGPDVFSRTLQANVGIGVGIVAFGAAMGALVAVVYVCLLGRVGRLRPRPLALAVSGAGFLSIYLVPFLKYPPNPPAIGHEETIRTRGMLFLIMVGASVAWLAVSVLVGRRLSNRVGNWNAVLVTGALFAGSIGSVMALLPAVGELSVNMAHYGHHATETPPPLTDASGRIVYPGFPADILAGFRLYSLGAQVILWTALALVFAPLADRLLARTTRKDVIAGHAARPLV